MALVLLGLIAYVTPWVISSSASLSPNAYDLAEWASLHPAARVSTPPLLISLLLRVPPACLALIVAFCGARPLKHWMWCISFVFFVAVALLPPIEFFTQARDDLNYQQQFTLSALTLIGGLIGISGIANRFRRPIILIAALIGGTVGVAGLAQGYELMRQFNLPVQVGSGGIFLAITLLGVAANQLHQMRTRAA